MIRQVPLLGYPSQLGAITALLGEGLGKRQIMDRTGLDGDRVSSLMAHARRAAAARAAGPEWTVPRVERAMRIYRAGLAVMAEAFGVSVAEFAEVVTHQVKNPEAKASEDNAITARAAEAPDTDGAGDASRLSDGSGPVVEASETPFGAASQGSQPSSAEGDPGSTVSSSPDHFQPPAEPPGEPVAEPPVAERFVNGQGFTNPAEPSELEAEREALAAEFPAAMRFSLRSADGQSLHQHGRGLTRLASFFWLGTAEQVARLKRQQPEWAQLQPKAWK